MNIDERLDRLTERHEAMAGTVQLMLVEGQRLLRTATKQAKAIEDLRRTAEAH